MSRREAIFRVHYAENTDEGQSARKRMVYEELLLFQLKLQALKAINRQKTNGIAHPIQMESGETVYFQFAVYFNRLTEAGNQGNFTDLRQPYRMNRLLQGDVGSGKTVVAATALFAVVKAGYQGALMAPTEILAEQHARSLQSKCLSLSVSRWTCSWVA